MCCQFADFVPNSPTCIKLIPRCYGYWPRFSSFGTTDRAVDRIKGSNSRRTILQGRLETAHRKAVLRLEKPAVTSSTTTPSVSRASSVNSTPFPDLSLGRVNVSLSRCSSTEQGEGSKKTRQKSSKAKKN